MKHALPQNFQITELGLAVTSALPEGVMSSTVRIETTMKPFGDCERRATKKMSPARQAEFLSGRNAARTAMQKLGSPAVEIPRQDDRSPLWPARLVGSITHTGPIAIAAIAASNDLTAIGLDIEPHKDLKRDLWKAILNQTETNWVQSHPEANQGRLARLIFSAKEAAYKCQYPISCHLFGFDAMHVDVDLIKGSFTARYLEDIPPFVSGFCLNGTFVIAQSHIICVVSIVPSQLPAAHLTSINSHPSIKAAPLQHGGKG